jgi:transcriptional regulator with XRE-family HTH domain
MLSRNKILLLHPLGYQASAAGEDISRVANIMPPLGLASMAAYLEQRGMSGNQLAKASGVTEGTIRNLLKQGEDPVVSSPHPLVLRSISEVLGLDVVRVLQMLDYIPSDYRATPLSPIGEYVGLSFDQLQPDGQRVLLGVLATLTGDESLNPKAINALAQSVRELRKAYPMFIERRFDFRDEVGRTFGSFFGMFSDAQLLYTITRRLNELFQEEPENVITEERVRAAANHPHGRVVLNLLLPRKEIPNPLEKLYWLMFPNDTYGKQEQEISDKQQEGIRALWRILSR